MIAIKIGDEYLPEPVVRKKLEALELLKKEIGLKLVVDRRPNNIEYYNLEDRNGFHSIDISKELYDLLKEALK